MAKSSNKKSKSEDGDIAKPIPGLEDVENFASAFKALGDPTRLRIVLFLQGAEKLAMSEQEASSPEEGEADSDSDNEVPEKTAPGGITVGEVACYLTGSEKVTSSVSHHLKELRHAGLVTMKRRGKNILCRLDKEAVTVLCRLLAEPEK